MPASRVSARAKDRPCQEAPAPNSEAALVVAIGFDIRYVPAFRKAKGTGSFMALVPLWIWSS
jgi:hypothetical protein